MRQLTILTVRKQLHRLITLFLSIMLVDIDLYGQVNAESAGVKQISGAGGQLDFVQGAYFI